MTARSKPAPPDFAYSCGSKANAGRCATCPPWCRGRAEYDRLTPRWELVLRHPEDQMRGGA